MPESHQGIHSGGSPSWAEAVPAAAPAQEGSSPAGLWERRVDSARNPSWFLQAVLTHFRSQAHRHLPAKARGSPPPPPPSGLVASMGKLVRGRVPFIFITQVAIYCVLFIFQVFSLSIVMLFYFIFASRELGVLFIHCADEETEPQKGFVIC